MVLYLPSWKTRRLLERPMLMSEELENCHECVTGDAPKQESWMAMFWKRWIRCDEQALEIARLKTEVADLKQSAASYFAENTTLRSERDAAKKAEEAAVTANRTLQETIAANGLQIEERDDRIEQLDNRCKMLWEDLDAKTKKLSRLESACETLIEAMGEF